MFTSIHAEEIFDLRKAQASEDHPSYWLAQLRKSDWFELLRFVDVKMPKTVRKQVVAEAVLQHFDFATCEGRGGVWQVWIEMRQASYRGLVIQFRHPETNWGLGIPEFVYLEKNDPLGLVNIAARLICKVK